MKNTLLLFAFACTMFLGTQSALAQDANTIKKTAFNKAQELGSIFKLDNIKAERIYNAYKTFGAKQASINKEFSLETEANKTARLDLQKELQTEMKSIFGNSFKRYLVATNQDNVLE